MASLVRLEPLRDLMGFSHDLDRLFGDLGAWRPGVTTREIGGTLMPTMDVFTRGEDLVLRAELPGVSAEDVDISVTDDVLTLTAERHEDKKVEEEDYLLRETSWGTVRRTMRLPEGAEAAKIHATYSDGILEITVPSAAPKESRTHKIAIESPSESKKELKGHH